MSDAGVHAIAIKLDLVQPVRPVGCLFDELRKLGFDPGQRGRSLDGSISQHTAGDRQLTVF